MGLWPTHKDESPVLAPTDSKWVIRDFRRSAIAIYQQLARVGEPDDIARRLVRSSLYLLPVKQQNIFAVAVLPDGGHDLSIVG